MTHFNRWDICLAWYHLASQFHSGQWSDLYSKFGQLNRLRYRPGWSEEYFDSLASEENVNAREIFLLNARKIDPRILPQVGVSVSHGTLREPDLAHAFLSEIDRQCLPIPADLRREAETLAEGDTGWEDAEIVLALADILNDQSPEGCHFGSHEGDGSDFGYWPIDQEEE